MYINLKLIITWLPLHLEYLQAIFRDAVLQRVRCTANSHPKSNDKTKQKFHTQKTKAFQDFGNQLKTCNKLRSTYSQKTTEPLVRTVGAYRKTRSYAHTIVTLTTFLTPDMQVYFHAGHSPRPAKCLTIQSNADTIYLEFTSDPTK